MWVFSVRFSYENRSENCTGTHTENERAKARANGNQCTTQHFKVRTSPDPFITWFGFGLRLFSVFSFQFFNLLPNNGTHSHFSKSTVIKCHYWTTTDTSSTLLTTIVYLLSVWTHNRERERKKLPIRTHMDSICDTCILCLCISILFVKCFEWNDKQFLSLSLSFIVHFMRNEWQK